MVAVWFVLLRGRISTGASALFLVAAAVILASAALPVVTVLGTATAVGVAVVVLEVQRVRDRREPAR
jgi:hypothetical protein